eukprot:2761108-Pleurochrysis_carterae.AAC.3
MITISGCGLNMVWDRDHIVVVIHIQKPIYLPVHIARLAGVSMAVGLWVAAFLCCLASAQYGFAIGVLNVPQA